MQEYKAMSVVLHLADTAVVQEGHSKDNVDIINAISEACCTDDLKNIYKSTSLSRVKEIGVKMGTAKHKHFVRATRCLINQH
uniref:Uncharacterized protein n=1 Tax=Arion vulgaris TaxID=1028688 RepID=A0A0B7BQV6_9EUPU